MTAAYIIERVTSAADIEQVLEVEHASFTPAATGYPLVVVLDANTDWLALESNMAKIYGGKSSAAGDSANGKNAVRNLQSRAADVTLQVNFGAPAKGAALLVIAFGASSSKVVREAQLVP